MFMSCFVAQVVRVLGNLGMIGVPALADSIFGFPECPERSYLGAEKHLFDKSQTWSR